LSGVQAQYQDKVLLLEQQIAKMTKDNIEEAAVIRQRYEQKLADQDQAIKRERQNLLNNENLLRKQLDEVTEKLSEEKRNNSRSYDETIIKLNRGILCWPLDTNNFSEKDEAIRLAEKKAQEEVTHSIALHRDALQQKERQHSDALEALKRTQHQELQAALSQQNSVQNLNEFLHQMQSSTTTLKSIQKQMNIEFSLSVEERENNLKNREKELDKREENLARQQRDAEKEQKNLQVLLNKMDERIRELQYSSEDEKRRLQQEAKQLDVRKSEFEIEVRTTKENIEKEQRRTQMLREEKIREKEDFLAEMMQERRMLAGLNMALFLRNNC
jgi:myosin heavy subunit